MIAAPDAGALHDDASLPSNVNVGEPAAVAVAVAARMVKSVRGKRTRYFEVEQPEPDTTRSALRLSAVPCDTETLPCAAVALTAGGAVPTG